MRLGSDLASERERSTLLEGQLVELSSKLANAMGETERLREELAEKGRADAALRQEVRWVDEASSKARMSEEEERREADANLHAQVGTWPRPAPHRAAAQPPGAAAARPRPPGRRRVGAYHAPAAPSHPRARRCKR